MTAAALLARVREAGLTLTAHGDRLRWRGPKPQTELLHDLAEHKAAILALLSAEDATHVAASIERRAAAALDGYEPPLSTPVPEWPALGTVERDRLDALNRQIGDGYCRAALQRPPSWWRAEEHGPTAGATCSCCGGQRWWSRDRCGWCCRRCHPPVGDGIVEVRS
jgi:hypothetical protein